MNVDIPVGLQLLFGTSLLCCRWRGLHRCPTYHDEGHAGITNFNCHFSLLTCMFSLLMCLLQFLNSLFLTSPSVSVASLFLCMYLITSCFVPAVYCLSSYTSLPISTASPFVPVVSWFVPITSLCSLIMCRPKRPVKSHSVQLHKQSCINALYWLWAHKYLRWTVSLTHSLSLGRHLMFVAKCSLFVFRISVEWLVGNWIPTFRVFSKRSISG